MQETGDSEVTVLDKGKAKKEVKKLRSGTLSAISSSYGHLLQHYAADAFCDIALTSHPPVLEHWRPDHLQASLLWMFSMVPAPRFVHVRNKGLVANVVFVVVRGATHQDWEDVAAAAPAAVPLLSSWPCVKTKQPRGAWSPLRKELLPIDTGVFFSKDADEMPAAALNLETQKLRLAPLSSHHALATAMDLCLNLDELRSHGFLLPRSCDGEGASGSSVKPPADGYVLTRTAARDAVVARAAAAACGAGSEAGEALPLTDDHPLRILAVDCEMCQIAGGVSQLARVTVVDEHSTVLLDEIVRPEKPILDYVTEFSGMTPALIASARLSMSEVQRRVVDLIDGVEDGGEEEEGEGVGATEGGGSNAVTAGAKRRRGGGASASGRRLRPAILVGHSLVSDLSALRIVHTRVIDTTVLYPHPSSLPYRQSLRNLARMHLGRAIQSGNGGHDSAEDALAALHLVLLHLHKNVPTVEAGAGAAPPRVPDFGQLLSCRGREGMVMPPQPDDRRRSAGAAGASSSLGGGAHVAGAAVALAVLSTGAADPDPAVAATATAAAISAATRASPIVTLDVRRPASRRTAHTSIFASPELADSATCSGAFVIGSSAFVSPHVTAGSKTNAIEMPCTGLPGDSRRALAKAADAARRLHHGRMEGRWSGVGMTVVEVGMPPPAAASTPNSSGGSGAGGSPAEEGRLVAPWRTLDSLLCEWCSALPPGTVVFVSTTLGSQAATRAAPPPGCAPGPTPPGSEDASSDPRLWGSTFLHVVNSAQAVPPTS
jgi:hypothetical protein